MCTYIHIYIYTHIHIYIYVFIYLFIYLFVYLFIAANAEGLRRMSTEGTCQKGPNAGGGTQGPDVGQGTCTGRDKGSILHEHGAACLPRGGGWYLCVGVGVCVCVCVYAYIFKVVCVYLYIYIYTYIYIYIYIFIYLYIYIYIYVYIYIYGGGVAAIRMTSLGQHGGIKIWPLHDIVITNFVWCIACKREIGKGIVYCVIIVQ